MNRRNFLSGAALMLACLPGLRWLNPKSGVMTGKHGCLRLPVANGMESEVLEFESWTLEYDPDQSGFDSAGLVKEQMVKDR